MRTHDTTSQKAGTASTATDKARKPGARAAGQVGKAPHAPGESAAAHSDLRLPHERDQGLDATSAQPDPVMRQAHEDLKSGQVDTDLRQTPGLDAEKRSQLLRKRH
ncbi:MAG: hypothetical protein LBI66_03290 [Burkholderiaceae bacterium]|nr:hypothetical protein [Burkholderiaceae bacterium]